MQVFGGIGYIEETGIAQVLRDSRIAMIYEGSNGIQAQDLVLRKLLMEEGRCLDALLAGMEKLLEAGVCPDWWQARYEGWKATIKDIQAQARTAPEEAVVHGVGVIAAMG
jgi:myo-inositol catabolism protein IolC